MRLVHGLGFARLLSLLYVEGLGCLSFGVRQFLRQPASIRPPLLSERHLARLSWLEQRLVHGADVGIGKGGVVAIN